MNPMIDRLRSRTAAFAHDLLTIPVAWLLAYWLRFNLDRIPHEFITGALHSLPWVILIQGGVYWICSASIAGSGALPRCPTWCASPRPCWSARRWCWSRSSPSIARRMFRVRCPSSISGFNC